MTPPVRLGSILLVALLLVLPGCGPSPVPQAKDGVLDLRGIDLDRTVASLHGDWHVQPGALMSPDDSRPNQQTSHLPGRWNSFFADAPEGSATRYATFRLTVLLDTGRVREFAISCTEQSSAYALFLDGERILSNGTPGVASERETEEIRYRQNSFTSRNSRLEIVLQASNFHLDYPGRIFKFKLASRRRLESGYQRSIAAHLVAMGVLLIFSLQYLGFMALLIRERSYAYFGLFCLAWLVYGSFAPHQFTFVSSWWPGISFHALTRITLVAIAFATLFVGLFCQELFPNRFQAAANRFMLLVVAALAIVLPLVPFRWIFDVFVVGVAIAYVEMLLLCLSVALALKRKTEGAWIFAFGFGIFVATTAHDGLVLMGWSDSSFQMVVGGAVLALAEAFILSQRFVATHRANLALLAEVKEQNQELARLSRIKDDFLANTSHELRTPLHGILGLTQSVLNGARDLAPEVRRSLELVSGSATRLTRLVNDILDFAKIRHRDLRLEPQPIDLASLVPSLLPHFAPALAGKRVELRHEIEADLPPVAADPDRLVQILFNLCGNAIRHTDQGEVVVSARGRGEAVEISVRDTGTGIPADQRERIFEPFEQAEGQTRGGTGLGLSIARKLVELHGGTLELDSAPGKGSTFRFQLPLSTRSGIHPIEMGQTFAANRILPEAHHVQTKTVNTSGRSGAPGRRKVLAIDDEPVNLEVVKEFLSCADLEVITATDGVRALELIEEHAPALVLLDVMMPHRNGYEVCAEIRGHYTESELPILFLSARSRLEDVVHGFAVGGNDYVLKPFLAQELIARVNVQLRQRDEFRSLKENNATRLELACELMNDALDIWKAHTGKSKADLAEESGLWAVQMDINGWRRPATLDKYLDPSKIPRNPKWKTIQKTVEFVQNVASGHPATETLKEKAARLRSVT